MLPDLKLLSAHDVKRLFAVQLREFKEASNSKGYAEEMKIIELTLNQLSTELQGRNEPDLRMAYCK